MKKIYILFLFLICTHVIADQKSADQFLKKYDQMIYDPSKAGVIDLVFDIKSKDLRADLEKAYPLFKIKDPYYRVYWTKEREVLIDVLGIPTGLEKQKQIIASNAYRYLEYIFPKSLEKEFREYNLKYKKEGKNTLITAKSKNGDLAVDEMSYLFNENGVLLETKSIGINGTILGKYEQNYYPWSGGKYFFTMIETTRVDKISDVVMTEKISHKVFKDVGLPVEITVEIANQNGGKKNIISNSTVFFENYQVNTQTAAKMMEKFQQGKK